jgi:hypothetical protein
MNIVLYVGSLHMTAAVKNVVMNISIAQELKTLVAEAARADRRSVSGLLEVLILENCPKIIESRKEIQVTRVERN